MKKSLLVVLTLVATTTYAEPLAHFKELVKQCSTAFDAQLPSEVFLNPKTGKWVKRLNGRAQLSYDVKRTDSLVSPYSAHISISQAITGKPASDEKSAQDLALSLNDANTFLTVTRLNFRFAEVDGQWTLIDGFSTVDFKSKPGSDFDRQPTKVALSKQSLIDSKDVISNSCLALNTTK